MLEKRVFKKVLCCWRHRTRIKNLFFLLCVEHDSGDQRFWHEHGQIEVSVVQDDLLNVGVFECDAIHDAMRQCFSQAYELIGFLWIWFSWNLMEIRPIRRLITPKWVNKLIRIALLWNHLKFATVMSSLRSKKICSSFRAWISFLLKKLIELS